MSLRKFHKVTSLPQTLDPDSFYYVLLGDGYVDEYITDQAGVAKQITTHSRIDERIDAKIAGFSVMQIVANIAARDALALDKSILVLVTDASADTTVGSGAALYAYDIDLNSFTKISEYESLDVVVNWADIVNRPASNVGDIDDAVNKKHSHGNLSHLNKLGTSANGLLQFDGQEYGSFATNNF